MAASPQGLLSGSSNTVRVPFLGPTATFLGLYKETSGLGLPSTVRKQVILALRQALSGQFADCLANLQSLRTNAATQLPFLIGPLKAEDLVFELDNLIRRVTLAQAGLISPMKLLF